MDAHRKRAGCMREDCPDKRFRFLDGSQCVERRVPAVGEDAREEPLDTLHPGNANPRGVEALVVSRNPHVELLTGVDERHLDVAAKRP